MESRVAVLKTLLYSDIFDYPLTKTEIFRYLIADKKISLGDISLQLKKDKHIECKNKLYFLKGKKDLVSLRKEKEKESLPKLKIAKRVIKKLFSIPTIKFIGISGNLSLKNAGKEDDIDLFIITKKNTIWLTRLLVVLVLLFLRIYRKKGSTTVKDKFCTNMFLDESALLFSKKRQNIFTAHEVSQLLPVADRDNTYKKFLLENKWILNYLPNLLTQSLGKSLKAHRAEKTSVFLPIVNHIVKFPQILYMKKNKTKEEISDKILAFHPQSHSTYVLREYKSRLQKYNL